MLMETSGSDANEEKKDLRPWAAYVLGRHSRTLRIRHNELWENSVGCKKTDLERQEWERKGTRIEQIGPPLENLNLIEVFAVAINPCVYPWDAEAVLRLNIEFAQVDMAIEVLVRHGRIDGVSLHNYHLYLRYYACCLSQIVENEPTWDSLRFPPDPDRHFGLNQIERTIASLLTDDDELKTWKHLGQVVGDYLSLFDDLIFGNISMTPESILGQANQILHMVRDLIAPSDYSYSQPIMTLLEEFCQNWPAGPAEFGPWSGAHLCWLDIARLDIAILLGLQEKVMPDPWLVLDREEVTLFGKLIPCKRGNRQKIACLWLLAENAGQPVRRQLIKETVGSERLPSEIQYIITYTRKLMKPLIALHFNETGQSPPPHAERAFIVEGHPDPIHANDGCTYLLKITPSRIQKTSIRPDWMKHDVRKK